jgi:NTP pyrophosphatase (non-canonical NTP hydrolase)
MGDAPYHLTVKDLVKQSHKNSADHGFWDAERTDETVPSKLMLIVSELSEALESYRDPESDQMVKVPSSTVEKLLGNWFAPADTSAEERKNEAADELEAIYEKWVTKPKGFEVEIADAFIRLGDLCGALGIDPEVAIRTKHEYNVGRPRMHGRRV